jgi:hypothetical protein
MMRGDSRAIASSISIASRRVCLFLHTGGRPPCSYSEQRERTRER